MQGNPSFAGLGRFASARAAVGRTWEGPARGGSAGAADKPAGVAFDLSVKLQRGQFGGDLGRGKPEVADQLILGQGAWAQPVEDLQVKGRDCPQTCLAAP